MPSFLSKVFGRKKDDKESATIASSHKRNSSLLEGKYEAVSPNVSPSATNYAEVSQQQAKEKENALSLGLFRSRSRNPADSQGPRNSIAPVPHLTLNLPAPKEEKARLFGVVFEADHEGVNALSSKDIAECRLSAMEATKLMKTCFDVIVSRGGLETLGLMHPHWHSLSPEIQQKLLTLFILSLPSRKAITTPPVSFNTELEYTRTVHDIAAVLRWGPRHLRLEDSSFGLSKGGDSSEWGWYASFAQVERKAGYPATAFTKTLEPLLPPAHMKLLTTTLDIVSSLAAHAETTGTSGSKLVKLFALWLLASDRAKAGEQWQAFYNRWDTAGRVLEHLFLAYVREEDSKNRMPLRLSELVKHYPYSDGNDTSTSGPNPQERLPFLPRPRFSTRLYDAIFIRIDTRLPSKKSTRPPGSLPGRLLTDSLKCNTADDAVLSSEAVRIWQEIKSAATTSQAEGDSEHLDLARILDDETLRLFALAPEPRSPALTVAFSPTTTVHPADSQRRRSSSAGGIIGNGTSTHHIKKTATANGAGAKNDPPISPSSPSLTNWADFSMVGFGETSLGKDFASSLLDNDVETTTPQADLATAGTKKRRLSSPTRGRSRSRSRQASIDKADNESGKGNAELMTNLAQINMIQVDEAFFDFWSDALLDPIASNWPQFIVCHLKPSMFPVSLLVIEHSYSYPPPPPSVEPEQVMSTNTNTSSQTTVAGNVAKKRRSSSPGSNLSASARKNSAFSLNKKRFSFFASVGIGAKGPSSTTLAAGSDSVKPSKSPAAGEMGEILAEVEEPVSTIRKKGAPLSESPKEGGKELPPAATPAIPLKSSEPPSTAALPPVPIIDVTPPTATITTEFPPVVIEPLKTDVTEKPLPLSVVSPTEIKVPADPPVAFKDGTVTQTADDVLPPAPESVVLSGGTPGPQVALESSEPVALAEASVSAEPESPQAETAPSSPHHTSSSRRESLPDVSTLSELVAAASVDEDMEEVQGDESALADPQGASAESTPAAEKLAPQIESTVEPLQGDQAQAQSS